MGLLLQLENNLNHELNVIDNNEYKVIKNHLGIPTSIREVSVVFAKHNTTSILRELRIAYVDVTSELAQYGKRMPVYSNEEIEEIVKEYSSVVAQTLDDDAVLWELLLTNINYSFEFFSRKSFP